MKEVVRWCCRNKRVGTLVLISKGTVKKPTKWQLHDLGIACLLWIRERTSRGIGKNVGTREMEADWTWPGLSVRGEKRQE